LKKEGDTIHFVAVLKEKPNEPVGCLLLTPLDQSSVKMRQVAVDEPFQGQGIGKLMVKAAEQWTETNNFEWISCYARESVLPFYHSLGYSSEGDIFIESVTGLPHQLLKKRMNNKGE